MRRYVMALVVTLVCIILIIYHQNQWKELVFYMVGIWFGALSTSDFISYPNGKNERR